jgi:hypothetical protein
MLLGRGMAPNGNPPPLQAGSNFFPAQTLSFYFFLWRMSSPKTWQTFAGDCSRNLASLEKFWFWQYIV